MGGEAPLKGINLAREATFCCGRANIDHLCRLNFDQGLLLT